MTTALVTGTVLGVVYALLAAVLVFVYEATGVLNFAIGGFALVAGFTFATLSTMVPPWAAWLIVIAGAVPIGAIVGLCTVAAQRAGVEIKAAASLAAVVAAEGLTVLVWGTNPRAAPYLTDKVAFYLGGVPVTWERLVAAALAIIGCVLLTLFLRLTRTGSAVRAMASNDEIARLIGLSVKRLWVLAWLISTTVIALIVVVILPDVGLSTDQLTFVVLTPLAAVLVAGFRSVPVAAVAALALGLVEGIFSAVRPLAAYQDVCPLGAVLLALLLPIGRANWERMLSHGHRSSV